MKKGVALFFDAIATACKPVSTSGPNNGPLAPATASQLINKLCGGIAPTFDGFLGAVTKGYFCRDPRTDHFNHILHDKSFDLIESQTTDISRMELSGTRQATGEMNLNQDAVFANGVLGPSLIFTFQSALEGDNQHAAWIKAGVR